MDDRKAVLKSLKKECRQGKREHYISWKVLAVLALVLALIGTVGVVFPQLRDRAGIADVLSTVEGWLRQAESALRTDGIVSAFQDWLKDEQLSRICGFAAAVCLCLFVVFAALWGRGKRKWKRSGAYLDYRTMQVTLKAERQTVKGK